MGRRVATVLIFGLVVGLVPATALAQPPANDDFADATPVTSVPFNDVVDVSEATVEDGEPTDTCAPFANTVWYEVTLGTDTMVTVDTAGSDYDTALAVWTGTDVDDLDEVACVDDTFFSLQARLTFAAEAGTTYFVQAGAFASVPPGQGTLRISFERASPARGRPEIFKESFRGNVAGAFVDDFDGDSWSFTDIFLVDGRQKTHRNRPFRITEVFVSTFEESFDKETGSFTFTSWSGSTTLSSDEFSFDRRLRSAHVDAEVTLFGFTCTETEPEPINGDNGNNGWYYEVECQELGSTDASVAVHWAGEGPTFRSMFLGRFATEGFRNTFRSQGTSRSADVTGGIESDEISQDLGGAWGFLSQEAWSEMMQFRGGNGFFAF